MYYSFKGRYFMTVLNYAKINIIALNEKILGLKLCLPSFVELKYDISMFVLDA